MVKNKIYTETNADRQNKLMLSFLLCKLSLLALPFSAQPVLSA